MQENNQTFNSYYLTMEKLIELLNEYEKSSFEKDTNWVYEGDEWEYYEPNNRIIKGNWENKNILTRFELCSKQFGFIQWLVEHQKIDLFIPKQYFFDKIFSDTYEGDFVCEVYEIVIIVLSIQDNPIEFLISVLK